jgi:hypothetical protein
MSTVEKAVAHRMTDQHQNNARSSKEGPLPDDPEAPHAPYAVYFAVLVLWCGDFMSEDPLTASQLRAPIIRGEKILLLHKVHVAQLLAKALGGIA